MELIDKNELLEKLNALIEARKNKPCSKQALVESASFKYLVAIVNSMTVYEKD